jgi:hypothetical protein
VSLWTGVIAFGVGSSASDNTICGTSDLADAAWHHVAVTRRASDGRLQLYVDGVLEAQALGPTGDVSYRDGRATPWPKDPFLVLGTEKHDVQHTPYAGWLDELRLSTVLRYTANFTPPAAPFTPDAATRRPLPLRRGLGHGDPRPTTRRRAGAAGGAGAVRFVTHNEAEAILLLTVQDPDVVPCGGGPGPLQLPLQLVGSEARMERVPFESFECRGEFARELWVLLDRLAGRSHERLRPK